MGLSSTSASRTFLALSSSLGLEPGCFLGGKRPTFPAGSRVAFDRRATYPESPGDLALGHPSVYGFEDLDTQVCRIGFHAPMMHPAQSHRNPL